MNKMFVAQHSPLFKGAKFKKFNIQKKCMDVILWMFPYEHIYFVIVIYLIDIIMTEKDHLTFDV